LQLFWRKGYAATSIEDLVAALNLSRSSLYDTFGDKRTLFIDSLKLYSTRVIAKMTETLKEAPSALAGIETALAELAESVGTERGAMGCFMVNSVAELTPYDREVTEIATAYSTEMQRLLSEALKQDGAASKQSAEQKAAYVFNTIQGLRILIKSGATRKQVQGIITLTLTGLH